MALERLQKIIAAAGVASRRAAEEMMLHGEVTVNGRIVTELGTKADAQADAIKVRGKLINAQLLQREMKYYLINKPRGYVSTVSDPQGRTIVAHLLPPSKRRGLHPVGRLDYNTEGLILMTNDGDLTHLLTKGGTVEKVYHVKVKGSPNVELIDRLRRGIKLGQSHTAPAQITLMERTKEGGNTWFEVILKEGKNQQIRKMFDHIHHSVTKLRRVRIGHLTDKELPVGQFRELKPGEVKRFFQPVQAPKKNKAKKPRAGARSGSRAGSRARSHS
ncbi:MAG: rRNA synthase [Blastocatellia bacterium]